MDPYDEEARKEFPNGEAGVVALVRLLLRGERLAEALDLPAITNWEQEFRFPRGSADFVLFHVDGSITVLEAKAALSDREILAGIGQLSLYAMQAGMGYRDALIRRVLVAPVAGKGNEHLLAACALAGVSFGALGPIDEVRATWRRMCERHGTP